MDVVSTCAVIAAVVGAIVGCETRVTGIGVVIGVVSAVVMAVTAVESVTTVTGEPVGRSVTETAVASGLPRETNVASDFKVRELAAQETSPMIATIAAAA